MNAIIRPSGFLMVGIPLFSVVGGGHDGKDDITNSVFFRIGLKYKKNLILQKY